MIAPLQLSVVTTLQWCRKSSTTKLDKCQQNLQSSLLIGVTRFLMWVVILDQGSLRHE